METKNENDLIPGLKGSFSVIHSLARINLYECLISAFREFLVNLMAAPGTLLPADIFNAKDTTIFKPYNPKVSRIPSLHHSNDVGISSAKPTSGLEEGSSQNFGAEAISLMDGKLGYGRTESVPSSSGVCRMKFTLFLQHLLD